METRNECLFSSVPCIQRVLSFAISDITDVIRFSTVRFTWHETLAHYPGSIFDDTRVCARRMRDDPAFDTNVTSSRWWWCEEYPFRQALQVGSSIAIRGLLRAGEDNHATTTSSKKQKKGKSSSCVLLTDLTRPLACWLSPLWICIRYKYPASSVQTVLEEMEREVLLLLQSGNDAPRNDGCVDEVLRAGTSDDGLNDTMAEAARDRLAGALAMCDQTTHSLYHYAVGWASCAEDLDVIRVLFATARRLGPDRCQKIVGARAGGGGAAGAKGLLDLARAQSLADGKCKLTQEQREVLVRMVQDAI